MKKKKIIFMNWILLFTFFSLLIFPFSNIYENNRFINNTIEKKILKTSDSSTYVIITTEAIQSNSENLIDFKHHKEGLGFEVEIINETNYGSGTGLNRVINIRTWLIDNYSLLNIEYVLLIGDPDPSPSIHIDSIPMLMCFPRYGASQYDKCPTDYIYADLTGDWNEDGDAYYGEYDVDDVDFNAEVYVGRIPVYNSNYTALDDILNRIIQHHSNSGEEKNKILLPMAISNYQDEDHSIDPRTDGLDCPYYVYNNIVNPMGMEDTVMYEMEGLSPVSPTAFHYNLPLTKSNFISEFNEGYGAVFWWAHGSNTGASRKYWNTDTDHDGIADFSEMTWIDFINSNDKNQLEKDQPAFFYMSSCLNGFPEDSENLGYVLLDCGAAISTICSSRVSWYRLGTWEPSKYVSDNTNIGYSYFYNLLRNKMTNGKALYSAKASGGEYWGEEDYMNKMDFNLYGDPQLSYWKNSDILISSQSTSDDDSSDSIKSQSILNDQMLFFIIIGIIGVGTSVILILVIKNNKKSRKKSLNRDELFYGAYPTQSTKLTETPTIYQSNQSIPFSYYCVQCGSLVNPEATFCTKCGAKIVK